MSASMGDRTEHRLVSVLMEGSGPPCSVHDLYAVLAVRLGDTAGHEAEDAFRRHCGSRILCLLGTTGGHVLVPAGEADSVQVRAELARAELGRAWVALGGWGGPGDLPDVRRSADDLLAMAVALYDPGVYELGDLAVEYAVASSPVRASAAAAAIAPVLRRPVLRLTLEALIAAHGNLPEAGGRLGVRSEVLHDRLRRIETLTGHAPDHGPGLDALRAACAAYALTSAGSDGDRR